MEFQVSSQQELKFCKHCKFLVLDYFSLSCSSPENPLKVEVSLVTGAARKMQDHAQKSRDEEELCGTSARWFVPAYAPRIREVDESLLGRQEPRKFDMSKLPGRSNLPKKRNFLDEL